MKLKNFHRPFLPSTEGKQKGKRHLCHSEKRESKKIAMNRLRIPGAYPRLRSQSPRSKPAKGPRSTEACINYSQSQISYSSHTSVKFRTHTRLSTWYGTRWILAEFQTAGEHSTKNPCSPNRRATFGNFFDPIDNLSYVFFREINARWKICVRGKFVGIFLS